MASICKKAGHLENPELVDFTRSGGMDRVGGSFPN
jgi:hypothetical protein